MNMMIKLYLKTRNPTATPKARIHIPMTNGGQLVTKKLRVTLMQTHNNNFF